MTRNGADGDGGSLSTANAKVKLGDIFALPIALSVMSRDDISSLDESPLEILIALRSHFAVAGFTPAGSDTRGGIAVATELRHRREAGDGSDLPIDDNGKNISHAGKGFLGVACWG